MNKQKRNKLRQKNPPFLLILNVKKFIYKFLKINIIKMTENLIAYIIHMISALNFISMKVI